LPAPDIGVKQGVKKMDASGLIADDVISLIAEARRKLLRELQKIG
jgi:hypothetical protein